MTEGTSRSLPLLGLCLLLAGCAPTQVVPASAAGAEPGRVTGSVTYRERIALPPTAVVKVRLVDVSHADAPAELLAEQAIIAAGRQVPFAFALAFDAAAIDPAHTYAVQARIEDEGRLLFVSDTHHPVITRDQPLNVDIVVRRVAAPDAAPQP
jgi:putative lipoprotein